MIYLDNSATTKPCKEAFDAMSYAVTECYGNPSSLHAVGSRAAELLLNARNEILVSLFGASIRSRLPHKPGMNGGEEYGKLIFTASGTESDNLAITGAVNACKVKTPEIIISDSEHPAVFSTAEALEKSGVKVHRLKTVGGIISLEELRSYLNANTVLVSVMYVNNETGAIYDVPSIFKTVKEFSPDILCHTDCVQAYQKVPFTPNTLNADFITLSAHKVHGVKGVGALWVRNEVFRKNRLSPVIFGGGQEYDLRSGTENLPGIAAFAAAVKANGSANSASHFISFANEMRQYLIEQLPDDVTVNTPKGAFTSHIISISTSLPKSQPLLNYLSSLGIYVSSGSACSSHKKAVSRPLTAFGLLSEVADGTIRVSLDTENTKEDIDVFCDTLKTAISKLKKHPNAKG